MGALWQSQIKIYFIDTIFPSLHQFTLANSTTKNHQSPNTLLAPDYSAISRGDKQAKGNMPEFALDLLIQRSLGV